MRNDKLISGFLDSGFDFKGIHYNPISARTLLLLERCKSPYYFGGNQLRGLLDCLYICSHSSKEVLAVSPDDWEVMILDYADSFATEDLTELGDIVNKSNEDSAAAVVEVRNNDGKKKQDKNPIGPPR